MRHTSLVGILLLAELLIGCGGGGGNPAAPTSTEPPDDGIITLSGTVAEPPSQLLAAPLYPIEEATVEIVTGEHAGRQAVTNVSGEYCIAPGFLDSDLKVIISTQPRPGRRSRVALEPGCDSRTSPASTARCTSA